MGDGEGGGLPAGDQTRAECVERAGEMGMARKE